jgi:hypothetical protein
MLLNNCVFRSTPEDGADPSTETKCFIYQYVNLNISDDGESLKIEKSEEASLFAVSCS